MENKEKVGILEPDSFSQTVVDKLSEQFIVEFYDETQSIESFIFDKNIIFVRLKYQITKALVTSSKVRLICSPTTGLNHIDKSLHSMVVSLKNEFEFLNTIRATPEHSFGLALSLLRNYKQAFLSNNNKKWNRDEYRGYEVFENSVGIIGLGRVGKILCKYYETFGAKIYFYDDKIMQADNAIACSDLEDLIRRSNIIHLCTNYTDQNKNMIYKKHFRMMKNKYFINTARGELLNEKDLLEFVKEGAFKGIAIDVISNETSSMNILNELLTLSEGENIIVTPHISGATYSSMRRTEEFIYEKLMKTIEI